jgi:hypothetical protein
MGDDQSFSLREVIVCLLLKAKQTRRSGGLVWPLRLFKQLVDQLSSLKKN